mmetsp:Transcript_28670/g.56326  ORF Transcript_28670/g.56326 Transcript_28670/m.56326 type:complete len:533 (-) Transcript_28670:92-1690(-)
MRSEETKVEEHLPKQWADDNFMGMVVEPLKANKSDDPEDWTIKLQFWEGALSKFLALQRGSVTFTMQDLKSNFMHQGSFPECLENVVSVLIEDKKVIKTCDLRAMAKSEFSLNPVAVVTSLMGWLMSPSKKERFVKGEEVFVLRQDVKNKAMALFSFVLSSHPSLCEDIILSLTDLSSIHARSVAAHNSSAAAHCDSSETVELLLCELAAQKKVVEVFSNSGPSSNSSSANFTPDKKNHGDSNRLRFFKFARTGEAVNKTGDYSIGQLKRTATMLEERIAKLQAAAGKKERQAKQMLASKHREVAKRLLHCKKQLDTQCAQNFNNLHNVEALLRSLTSISEDTELLKVMQESSAAIFKIQQETGLTEDVANDIMDDVKDAIDSSDAISEAVADSSAFGESTDAELEAEYQALLSESEGSHSSGATSNPAALADRVQVAGTNTGLAGSSDQVQVMGTSTGSSGSSSLPPVAISPQPAGIDAQLPTISYPALNSNVTTSSVTRTANHAPSTIKTTDNSTASKQRNTPVADAILC